MPPGSTSAMRVYFINADYPSSSFAFLLSEMLENSPAGVILITSRKEIVACGLKLRRKLPCALIAFDPVSGADCVYADRCLGVCNVIAYLHRKGWRRIAFCETFHSESPKRRYLRAVRDYGLPRILIPGGMGKNELIRRTGYLNGKMFASLPEKPDAVQTSDYMPRGLFAGCPEIGLRVPDDVAVFGFDNREFAALLNSLLSTLAQPHFEASKHAASFLFRRLEHPEGEPETVRIPMSLLIRKST